ncbi:MAG: DUF1501 domain-containing protein [Gammaproteobacteria bacterium]|nr:DUF1501 domain-containing protein [Gammaproteobacteria bacterium]
MSTRRQFLTRGAAASASVGCWALGATPRSARAAADERILVVFELSGGNDGLNTIVPYGDDTYYRLRPKLGLQRERLLTMDEHWGMNPGLAGLHRLWDDGRLAVVHGCGYAHPSYSHFTSMAYWHTAAPNSGDAYGWVGRLADAMAPEPRPNFIVNIDTAQSLAVKSRHHTPVVFDDPERFQRLTLATERGIIEQVPQAPTGNANRDFLNMVAKSANESSQAVREACRSYHTPVDYGLLPAQLDKVAACIDAGLPTRLYYLAFRNNAFDTHVQQADLHQRLLTYASDAVHGFLADLERLGQGHRVAVMMFSEFGRRAGENTNLGTDHGTANVMLLAGQGVRGGHYGEPCDLTDLDDTDNLRYTTDFRRVYASAIDGWLRTGAAEQVLKARFEPLPIFGA